MGGERLAACRHVDRGPVPGRWDGLAGFARRSDPNLALFGYLGLWHFFRSQVTGRHRRDLQEKQGGKRHYIREPETGNSAGRDA